MITNDIKQDYDFLPCLRIASYLIDRGVCPALVGGALATQVCRSLILELTGNSSALMLRL